MNETARRPQVDETWRRASNGKLYAILAVDNDRVTVVDERQSTVRMDRFLLGFDFAIPAPQRPDRTEG